MEADYLVWVQDGSSANLLHWNGGSWEKVAALSSGQYRFDPPSAWGQTTLVLPFGDIGLGAESNLGLVAFATEEGAMKLWATMPAANPVNSALAAGSIPYADTSASLELSHGYHWRPRPGPRRSPSRRRRRLTIANGFPYVSRGCSNEKTARSHSDPASSPVRRCPRGPASLRRTGQEADGIWFVVERYEFAATALGESSDFVPVSPPIPGRGSNSAYAYLDTSARPGVPYLYRLHILPDDRFTTPMGPVTRLHGCYLPLTVR